MSSDEKNLNNTYIPPPTVPLATTDAPGYTVLHNQSSPKDSGYLAQQSNNTITVISTAPASQTLRPQIMPPNYIVLNLILLLCSCCLFGLVGLYYSLEVERQWKRGNHPDALKASRVAKNWGTAGGIIGAISLIGSILVIPIVPFILSVS